MNVKLKKRSQTATQRQTELNTLDRNIKIENPHYI